jgi:hypothetical protein
MKPAKEGFCLTNEIPWLHQMSDAYYGSSLLSRHRIGTRERATQKREVIKAGMALVFMRTK